MITKIASIPLWEPRNPKWGSSSKSEEKKKQDESKPMPALFQSQVDKLKGFKLRKSLAEDETFIDALTKRMDTLKISKEPKIATLEEEEIDDDLSDLEDQFKNISQTAEINKVTFGKPVQRTALTRNYYHRPSPVDIQYEDRDLTERAEYTGRSIIE